MNKEQNVGRKQFLDFSSDMGMLIKNSEMFQPIVCLHGWISNQVHNDWIGHLKGGPTHCIVPY